MTKKERDALQKFINRTTEIDKRAHEIFQSLQDMCRQHGKTAWCSASENRKELQDTGDAFRADLLYEEYLKLDGARKLIGDLGSTLAKLNFWKDF